jgi:hypothetical protein
MALTRSGDAFVFGPEGNGAPATGGLGIISKSTQRRYGSEVEIVGKDGELVDKIYSGAEDTITTTEYVSATTMPTDVLGSGTLTSTGVLTRVALQLSNEDLARVEKETLKITL